MVSDGSSVRTRVRGVDLLKHHETPRLHRRSQHHRITAGNLSAARATSASRGANGTAKSSAEATTSQPRAPWKKPSEHATRIGNSAQDDAGGLSLTSLPSLLVLGLYTTDRAAADKRSR